MRIAEYVRKECMAEAESTRLLTSIQMYCCKLRIMASVTGPGIVKKRPELYEDLLKYVDRGMEQSQYIFTQDCLKNIREMVYEKMQHTDEENK